MSERFEAPGRTVGSVEDWRDMLDGAAGTMRVEAFMAEHGLDEVAVGDALREYRSECGWSPYAGRDTVEADFLNWYRWERVG